VIAHCFTREQRTTIARFAGNLYVHQDGRYIKLESEYAKAIISRFIDSKVLLKEGKDTVAPTSWHVNETFTALCAQVMLPPELEPPCWLGKDQPAWGDAQVITLRNGLMDLRNNAFFPPQMVRAWRPWSQFRSGSGLPDVQSLIGGLVPGRAGACRLAGDLRLPD
jgi:hypothetical protein